jgi:hypothetical protein
VIPIAWKLSIAEELCQDRSCLLQRADYKNEGQNPKNWFYVRFLVKMVYLAWKLSTLEPVPKLLVDTIVHFAHQPEIFLAVFSLL